MEVRHLRSQPSMDLEAFGVSFLGWGPRGKVCGHSLVLKAQVWA